jgi:hypothetical protein
MGQETHLRNPGRRRAAIILALSTCLLTVSRADVGKSIPEAGSLSKSAADSLAAKFATLSSKQGAPSGPLDPIVITDLEANSYLKFRGHEFLPPALRDPEVHIMPGNITGAANVNFDELGGALKKDSGDLTSQMLSYVFRGTQRVTATGTLESKDGEGKFTLTNLTVGSTSLPPAFVTFMLQGYIEKQYKVDISKPFPLPGHVSRIELAPGRATIQRAALTRR